MRLLWFFFEGDLEFERLKFSLKFGDIRGQIENGLSLPKRRAQRGLVPRFFPVRKVEPGRLSSVPNISRFQEDGRLKISHPARFGEEETV